MGGSYPATYLLTFRVLFVTAQHAHPARVAAAHWNTKVVVLLAGCLYGVAGERFQFVVGASNSARSESGVDTSMKFEQLTFFFCSILNGVRSSTALAG